MVQQRNAARWLLGRQLLRRHAEFTHPSPSLFCGGPGRIPARLVSGGCPGRIPVSVFWWWSRTQPGLMTHPTTGLARDWPYPPVHPDFVASAPDSMTDPLVDCWPALSANNLADASVPVPASVSADSHDRSRRTHLVCLAGVPGLQTDSLDSFAGVPGLSGLICPSGSSSGPPPPFLGCFFVTPEQILKGKVLS